MYFAEIGNSEKDFRQGRYELKTEKSLPAGNDNASSPGRSECVRRSCRRYRGSSDTRSRDRVVDLHQRRRRVRRYGTATHPHAHNHIVRELVAGGVVDELHGSVLRSYARFIGELALERTWNLHDGSEKVPRAPDRARVQRVSL
jgi:hypothetical protein